MFSKKPIRFFGIEVAIILGLSSAAQSAVLIASEQQLYAPGELLINSKKRQCPP